MLLYASMRFCLSDLLLRSAQVLIINDEIKMKRMTANKLTVPSNKINQILLDEILNSTSTKNIKGLKRVSSLNVRDLEVKRTLNNLPLTLLKPSSNENSFEIVDELNFLGNVNAKQLNVKSINGFNVSALIENIFLTNERNLIRGSVIVKQLLDVDVLTAKNLFNIPIANLMTTATNQNISADVLISKFAFAKITTNTINDEILRDNIALVNKANVIEGEKS